MTSGAFWLTLACLLWGVLAIGGVYAWAYVPLGIAAAATGLLGLLPAGGRRPWELIAACGLIAAAISLQLAPLPASTLAALSPETPEALRQLDPRFAAGLSPTRAISFLPSSTRLAFVLFAAFTLLMAGASSVLSRTGSERLVEMLVILGVFVAFVGIIQKSFATEKIYGVWTPLEGRNPFGPFVNRNHFAGWMLMVLPLTLGLFCAGLVRAMRGVKAELRERLLWFSSAEASRLILLGLAASIMLLALVLTFSRSGFLAATTTILLMGILFLRSRSSPGRKVIVFLALSLMVAGVVSWVGTDRVGARFVQGDIDELGARRGAWADAWNVAERFPLTGTGINTYGVSMLLYQELGTDKHFSAAHNDYLQIAAEGGLLVGMPVLIALVVLTVMSRRRLREDRGSSHYWVRAGAVLGLVAIGIQELADFSLQMPGNAVMFAVVCAIAIHKRPSRPAAGGRRPDPDIVAPLL